MIRMLLLFLILVSCTSAFAGRINEILDHTAVEQIDPIDTSTLKKNQEFIQNSFSSSRIENPEIISLLNDKVIYTISLTYTRSSNVNYNEQRALNKDRLKSLHEIAPSLINNDLIQWRFLEQLTTGQTEKMSLHGFLVTYRPDILDKSVSEFRILKDMIEVDSDDCYAKSRKSKKARVVSTTYSRTASPPSYTGKYTSFKDYVLHTVSYTKAMDKKRVSGKLSLTFFIDQDGNLGKIEWGKVKYEMCKKEVNTALTRMPKWLPGNDNGSSCGGIFMMDLFFSGEAKTIFIQKLLFAGPYTEMGLDEFLRLYALPEHILCDLTISKVMARNPNWERMNIVADLTGSMYPYTKQLLLWFKLNTIDNKVNAFTFFNDGDDTPNALKTTGHVGGIYQNTARSYDSILDLARITMRYSGADIPENNIEAVLSAIDKYPDTGELVLIADNFATPRDMELIGKVDRPIKLILCGAEYGINIDYLNLIRINGGSLHTMEKDLTNLMRMNEGEHLEFASQSFVIQNGKFIRVTLN